MALPTQRDYDPRLSRHYQAYVQALDEALYLVVRDAYLDAVCWRIAYEVADLAVHAYRRLGIEAREATARLEALAEAYGTAGDEFESALDEGLPN